jgi:hypothetical protein
MPTIPTLRTGAAYGQSLIRRRSGRAARRFRRMSGTGFGVVTKASASSAAAGRIWSLITSSPCRAAARARSVTCNFYASRATGERAQPYEAARAQAERSALGDELAFAIQGDGWRSTCLASAFDLRCRWLLHSHPMVAAAPSRP